MWQQIAVAKWGPLVTTLRAGVKTDWAAYCKRRMSLHTIKCALRPNSILPGSMSDVPHQADITHANPSLRLRMGMPDYLFMLHT